MPLQTSGSISLADIAAEFGDTAPHSMSEFYRDGGKVPGVNSNVPASGLIRLGDFFGAVNELLQQVTAQASVNAQTIFGSNWGAAVPKRLLIPSGVTIGPLTIPSGLGGSLIVQNQGEIQGYGGGPNSGAGGHAITASSSFTLTNTGAVRGGGGGGGVGGTGGGGYFGTTVYEGPFGPSGSYAWQATGYNDNGNPQSWKIVWAGSHIVELYGNQYNNAGHQVYYNGITYTKATSADYSGVSRSYPSTVYTSGGGGGSGGRGQGYGQSLLGGSGGAGGGTNAGAGGTGGTGGNWGAVGNTGNSGASGNYTGGSGGAGGGAAGRAVLMLAGSLTLNNSGTLNGAY
jgi:hypothetical protein